MNKLLEVREFEKISCNPDFKTEYAYLPESVFRDLEEFIHAFAGDEEYADALEFLKISFRRNVGDIISVNNYVGLVQMQNGYQIQVLPKIDFGSDPDTKNEETKRVFLDASDIISYKTIYEALNATVGTDYTGWMKATWPSVYTSLPFRIWFPKLAETRNGKLVSAAFDCVNTISDDWNEVIFDDLKNGYVEGGEKYTGCTLIFAKEPQGGSYIFRGAYIDDEEKSSPNHYVSKRIGTKVKLTGQPSNAIEILDDFRKQ